VPPAPAAAPSLTAPARVGVWRSAPSAGRRPGATGPWPRRRCRHRHRQQRRPRRCWRRPWRPGRASAAGCRAPAFEGRGRARGSLARAPGHARARQRARARRPRRRPAPPPRPPLRPPPAPITPAACLPTAAAWPGGKGGAKSARRKVNPRRGSVAASRGAQHDGRNRRVCGRKRRMDRAQSRSRRRSGTRRRPAAWPPGRAPAPPRQTLRQHAARPSGTLPHGDGRHATSHRAPALSRRPRHNPRLRARYVQQPRRRGRHRRCASTKRSTPKQSEKTPACSKAPVASSSALTRPACSPPAVWAAARGAGRGQAGSVEAGRGAGASRQHNAASLLLREHRPHRPSAALRRPRPPQWRCTHRARACPRRRRR
jgi:hypothetical protein